MAKLKENQVTRSTSQALYKYVPNRWIDFYFSSNRRGYTAFVKGWSSIPLEDINKKRLLRKVSNAVQSYQKQCGSIVEGGESRCTKGFASEISPDTYTVLTPRVSETDRAINGYISPSIFFCEKCHQIHRFKRESQYSYIMGKKCARPNCGGNLVQLRDIYYCRCGWAGEVSIGDCDYHPGKPLLMRIRDHKYECSVCHRTTIIFRKCPECGERLTPNNVLDSAQSFVKSLSVIDLLDEKMDSFLSDEQDGAGIITANYLSLLSNEEFIKTVKYGRETQKEFQQITYEKMLQEFISQGIPEEYAKTAAESMVKTKDNDPVAKAIKKTTGYITDTSKLDQFAEAVLEYNTIKNSEDVLLLSDAVARSRELNTHPNPDIYFEIARKYGFSLVQASDKIPFIQCAYGYTREFVDTATAPKGGPVVLVGFPDETPEKKTVYATKLCTEGVLFELDHVKILKWLKKNGVIRDSDLPVDLDDKVELRAWFINNIDTSQIEPFSILSEDMPVTYYVYRLIHTISHTLIIAAAEICGLDKNSLSEYIFPAIPAVFIYCQNTQGFNMGALFSVFEMYFEKWMDGALKTASECIFDPICVEHEAACAGCVYTNEISCQHFNHDLDRTLLIGKYDKETGKRFWGFWED